MRSWLKHAGRFTLILGASVFVVGLAIDRNFDSARQAALFGASLGAAMGSLQYRLEQLVPAWSGRAVGLWLLSSAWGSPLVLAAITIGTEPDAPWTLPQNAALAAAISAGLSLVALLPLPWLQGQWGRKPAP